MQFYFHSFRRTFSLSAKSAVTVPLQEKRHQPSSADVGFASAAFRSRSVTIRAASDIAYRMSGTSCVYPLQICPTTSNTPFDNANQRNEENRLQNRRCVSRDCCCALHKHVANSEHSRLLHVPRDGRFSAHVDNGI